MARKKSTISKLIGSKSEYKGEKGRKKLIFKLIIYFIFWVALLCSLLFSQDINRQMNKTEFAFSETIAEGDYKVHFIDVGQGDSALIQFPDGKNMLIDTGESDSENNLLRYLDAVGVQTIDYLVLTHTDSDHVGNAVAVLETYDVIDVYIPTVYSIYEEEQGLDTDPDYETKDTKTWSAVVEAIYNEPTLDNLIRTYGERAVNDDNTKSTEPIVSEEYGYRVDFYTPLEEDLNGDWNAYSPIMMVNIQNVKYLFVGDADENDEEDFLNAYADETTSGLFDCDVLKVGHHGSGSSTSDAFLDVVMPEYAVISCGEGNSYGHPTEEALDRLEAHGAKIMRTDLLGSIVFGDGGTEVVESQSNYNHVDDTYIEWKYFVIVGGVILALCFILVIKNKKEDKKDKK